jgi:hypothetical protein
MLDVGQLLIVVSSTGKQLIVSPGIFIGLANSIRISDPHADDLTVCVE